MRDHTKLRAFELADEIALMTYAITRNFPKEEMFGLIAQMRKAAVSVPSNIVEGCTRSSQSEYVRFLGIAFGSLRELTYQANLSYRLDYIENRIYSKYEQKLSETGKVLSALIRSLR